MHSSRRKKKKDIRDAADLELLIRNFYGRINANEHLREFFTHTDWEAHIPVMIRFWENVLFFSGGYTGNPMQLHATIHKHRSINAKDFTIWLNLFYETADDLFDGPQVIQLKKKAKSISDIMQFKLLHQQAGKTL